MVLPGLPLHITQRGVNRCAIFIDDGDRQTYRRLLRRSCCEHHIEIHAYVLMDNHVHLLITPPSGESLARALRNSAQVYVQYFNDRHDRSGALWQGRFGSSPVESDRHLLIVLRYIELNPVRAGMVSVPEHYRWSSVHAHLGHRGDPLISPHAAYLSLGTSLAERAESYASLLREALTHEQLAAIRLCMAQQRTFGSDRFVRMVEKTLGLPARCRGTGRPRASGNPG